MFDNRLKRKDLNNKYDYYHVKNKINDKKQALIYLDELLNYLNQFDYYDDDNFIFGGRKKYLYDEIVRIIRNEQKEKEPLYFVLGSLEEFMCNGNMLNYNDVDKSKWINGKIIDGKDFIELRNKDDLYTNSGYICKQEKLKIIEIIDMIKKYIVDDMEKKDMGLFNKKDKYNIDAEDNRPQIIYGIPDTLREQWEKEEKDKKDEVKEKYDIKPEENLPREVYGIPNWLQEKRKNENNEKYDINPEDNVPQKVYGVPNYDFSQDKVKKESINIVVENYCLSLTKCDNKCDLLYVNNSETSYIKDSIVSISIKKFDEFCNKLKKIIADWNIEYSGDKNIVWKLKINIDGLNKQINGNGAYPKNWNKFIDLLSEYEILFKKSLLFDEKNNDEEIDLSFEKLVESKVKDSFFSKLIIDYFKNELNKNDIVSKKIFNDLSKYDDIFNEFTKYLVQKTYDIPNAINVEGYTAKQIAELNPNFKATGVYTFLNYLREKPKEAKETIRKGFPNKDVIHPTMNNDYYIKFTHIPFHGCYGTREELEKQEVKPIISYYKVITNTPIVMDKITVIVDEITSDGVKLTIPYQEGIIGNREKYKNKLPNEVTLKENDTFELYLDVYDAMESWEITLVDKKEDNSDEVKKYLKEMEPEVDEMLIKQGLLKIENDKKIPVFGSIQVRWKIEKQLLKERYNIDWLTPAERNPHIKYD